MRIERPLDGLSELEGEILAESHNKINNLRMHMRIIQQRPQLLKRKLLVIRADLVDLLLHDDQLEGVVNGMLGLPHQTLDHRLNG